MQSILSSERGGSAALFKLESMHEKRNRLIKGLVSLSQDIDALDYQETPSLLHIRNSLKKQSVSTLISLKIVVDRRQG